MSLPVNPLICDCCKRVVATVYFLPAGDGSGAGCESCLRRIHGGKLPYDLDRFILIGDAPCKSQA